MHVSINGLFLRLYLQFNRWITLNADLHYKEYCLVQYQNATKMWYNMEYFIMWIFDALLMA